MLETGTSISRGTGSNASATKSRDAEKYEGKTDKFCLIPQSRRTVRDTNSAARLALPVRQAGVDTGPRSCLELPLGSRAILDCLTAGIAPPWFRLP